MVLFRPVRSRLMAAARRIVPALLLALAVLAGCRDSPTDPVAGLVAGETDLAALALELPLVRPGEAGRDEGTDSEAVRAWQASWQESALEGRAIRQALHPRLGAHLAATRGPAELATELDLLGVAVRRAAALELDGLPEFLGAGIRRARRAEDRARAAAERDAPAQAWTALLEGADALREVGPEAVARGTVLELEERIRRMTPSDAYSEQELERIRHLVRGGRQAVEEGDWGRALRRAFYARELLGNG